MYSKPSFFSKIFIYIIFQSCTTIFINRWDRVRNSLWRKSSEMTEGAVTKIERGMLEWFERMSNDKTNM